MIRVVLLRRHYGGYMLYPGMGKSLWKANWNIMPSFWCIEGKLYD